MLWLQWHQQPAWVRACPVTVQAAPTTLCQYRYSILRVLGGPHKALLLVTWLPCDHMVHVPPLRSLAAIAMLCADQGLRAVHGWQLLGVVVCPWRWSSAVGRTVWGYSIAEHTVKYKSWYNNTHINLCWCGSSISWTVRIRTSLVVVTPATSSPSTHHIPPQRGGNGEGREGEGGRERERRWVGHDSTNTHTTVHWQASCVISSDRSQWHAWLLCDSQLGCIMHDQWLVITVTPYINMTYDHLSSHPTTGEEFPGCLK